MERQVHVMFSHERSSRMPLSSASAGFRHLFASHAVPGDLSKRNYTGAFNCFARIAREEGYRAFYKVFSSQKRCFSPS
jgi:hypothetical protein